MSDIQIVHVVDKNEIGCLVPNPSHIIWKVSERESFHVISRPQINVPQIATVVGTITVPNGSPVPPFSFPTFANYAPPGGRLIVGAMAPGDFFGMRPVAPLSPPVGFGRVGGVLVPMVQEPNAVDRLTAPSAAPPPVSHAAPSPVTASASAAAPASAPSPTRQLSARRNGPTRGRRVDTSGVPRLLTRRNVRTFNLLNNDSHSRSRSRSRTGSCSSSSYSSSSKYSTRATFDVSKRRSTLQ